MEVYQYRQARCITLPDCDTCTVTITLFEGRDHFKVTVMNISGVMVSSSYEKRFETRAEALRFYNEQGDLFSAHRQHPEVVWAGGVPLA